MFLVIVSKKKNSSYTIKKKNLLSLGYIKLYIKKKVGSTLCSRCSRIFLLIQINSWDAELTRIQNIF